MNLIAGGDYLLFDKANKLVDEAETNIGCADKNMRG